MSSTIGPQKGNLEGLIGLALMSSLSFFALLPLLSLSRGHYTENENCSLSHPSRIGRVC